MCPVETPDYLESGLGFGHSPEEGYQADGIVKTGALVTGALKTGDPDVLHCTPVLLSCPLPVALRTD